MMNLVLEKYAHLADLENTLQNECSLILPANLCFSRAENEPSKFLQSLWPTYCSPEISIRIRGASELRNRSIPCSWTSWSSKPRARRAESSRTCNPHSTSPNFRFGKSTFSSKRNCVFRLETQSSKMHLSFVQNLPNQRKIRRKRFQSENINCYLKCVPDSELEHARFQKLVSNPELTNFQCRKQ